VLAEAVAHLPFCVCDRYSNDATAGVQDPGESDHRGPREAA
jgi:hypothetical protein